MTIKRPFVAAISALAFWAGAVAAKDTVTFATQLEPPHLDPTAGAAQAIDTVVYLNIFEGLTRFTPEGGVVPLLAKSWEISPDGLTYTFMLQEGVTFHDGSPMHAEDVKFSLDRARAADSTNAQKALFAAIADVAVRDPHTVVITLSEPNGSLLFNLAWGDAVIVAPERVETLKTAPVGTGPYRLGAWIQGDRVELVRNPNYWGAVPPLTGATIKFISDPTAAFAALMAEDIDAFDNFPAPENVLLFEADPRFQVIVGSTEGETILATNNAQAPFDNPKVRAALAHAIDRSAIIDGAMFGYGTPIGSHFAPHHPAYVDLTAQSAYDPEKARALLAEAGLPQGFSTTLHLPPPAYARRSGEIVAAQLAAVGITAEIVNVEWAQWLETVFKGQNYGLSIVSHTEPMDIGIYAQPSYYFQYDNPDLQGLMTRLNGTTDPETRRDLLQQAQRIIADDHVNGYLFQLAKIGIAKAGLQGIWANAPTAALEIGALSWAE